MKKIQSLLFIGIAVAFIAVSCQKAYERPDLTTGGGTGGGNPAPAGSLLAKVETKTNGSTEGSTITYEYNSSSKLSRITTVATDSSNTSITYVYRYVRDAAGRVTKIVSNIFSAVSPNSGFPDSVDVIVHYPDASTFNFDYVAFSIPLGGLAYSDTARYTYSNGVITELQEYQAIGPQVVTRVDWRQFTYANNNIVTEKIFSPSVNAATTPIAIFTNEFDSKVQPLFTGNEGFLLGQNTGYASKNNMMKFTATDNSNGTVIVSLNYTYQYNSNNLPISGTGTETPKNKTTTVKFTYQ
ncbi:MAG: hypothetical protein V4557_15295 [Bacteroidota bacterium]